MTRPRDPIVVFAAVLALGFVPAPAMGELAVGPPVVVIKTGLNVAASGNEFLNNPSGAGIQVTGIDTQGCPYMTVTRAGPDQSYPYTVAAGDALALQVNCQPSTTHTIRRCEMLAKQNATTVGRFTGLCVYEGASSLSAAPNPLHFGTVDGSRTENILVMTPTFTTVSVHVADQDGNFIVGAPCPTNGPGCTNVATTGAPGMLNVQLTCFPQSPGLHAATLHVVGDNGQKLELPVDCTGGVVAMVPQLSVNPPNTTLTARVTEMASQTFAITNIGGAPLAISGYSLAPNPAWTIEWAASCMYGGCTLPPGAGTSVTATFEPLAMGPSNSSLAIASNGGNPTIDLFGTGLASQIELATDLGAPASLDLGSRPVGVTSNPPTTFALRNTGNAPLAGITLATTVIDGAYAISPSMLDLAPGEIEMVAVTCTAPSAASFDNTLRIRTTGALATVPSPLEIALHCRGTDTQLIASPSPVQLGEIRTGTQRSQTITLSTVGESLPVTSPPALTLPTDQMTVSAPTVSTITSATSSTFTLDVNATTDGDLANTITVTARDTVEIAVTGRVVTPAIAPPAPIDLGTFCIDQPTTATAATFTATGTASIQMMKPTLARPDSPFAIEYTSPVEAAYAPYQLPGNGGQATVTIQPQRQTEPGPQTDELVWTTDMPGQEVVTTPLMAEFLTDGGAIAPRTINFDPVAVNQRSQPRQVTLENCGDVAITLAPATIVPSDAFVDDSVLPLPAMLQPRERATISVTFAPVRAGIATAVLGVEASTGPLRVDLGGTGIGGSDGSGERKSFYACTCASGTPIGGAPIVLAIGGVLLRRRRRPN